MECYQSKYHVEYKNTRCRRKEPPREFMMCFVVKRQQKGISRLVQQLYNSGKTLCYITLLFRHHYHHCFMLYDKTGLLVRPKTSDFSPLLTLASKRISPDLCITPSRIQIKTPRLRFTLSPPPPFPHNNQLRIVASCVFQRRKKEFLCKRKIYETWIQNLRQRMLVIVPGRCQSSWSIIFYYKHQLCVYSQKNFPVVTL